MTSPADVTRPRVIWITHLPPPYRVPVWRALAQGWDVQIQCTENERGIGRLGSENRGADWRSSNYPDLRILTLRVLRLRLRSEPLWIVLPTRGAWRMRDAAVAVLGGGWESPSYWWLMLRAKLLRKPVVCFYESPSHTHRFTSGPVPLLRRFVFRHLDAVVVPGVAARRAVLAMGVPSERIFQGFNAVDVRRFAAQAVAARQTAPEADPHGHEFAYVGQLVPRKRVLELLEGFIAAAGPLDRLTVFGTGELEAAMRQRAAEAGVADRVVFTGYIDNDVLIERLARCHTLCLVSVEEVWGLVVNEALAAGLQVVVSENCGVAPSVVDMQGVFVVREDLGDLPAVLQSAAAAWQGPIEQPEILQHNPEAFAEVFSDAFRAVTAATAPAAARRGGR